jgi:hypothetical protein
MPCHKCFNGFPLGPIGNDVSLALALCGGFIGWRAVAGQESLCMKTICDDRKSVFRHGPVALCMVGGLHE